MPVSMKRTIAEAFLTLARQKAVDKITVKDLVKECHISRQTFYYHFQDLLEVLEWTFQQMTQQTLERTCGPTLRRQRCALFSRAPWSTAI